MSTQQDQLLSELNKVYSELDDIFHHLDNQKLTDIQATLLLTDVKQLGFKLDRIHNKLK